MTTVQALPKDVSKLGQEIKLFGKWETGTHAYVLPGLSSYDPRFKPNLRVEVKDISLQDYIQVHHPVYLPHTAGRYAKKQFKKAQMPIVERLVDRHVPTEAIPSQLAMLICEQSYDEGSQ